MERLMYQISVLAAAASIGLFFISTYLLGSQQRNVAETLSETASLTTLWAK